LYEKLKEESERFEDIYGNILESIYEATKEALGARKKKEQQTMVD
jgi:hypothetical protein